MAVTLAQAAVIATDDVQRGIVETFVQTGRVLDRLPLLTVNGNAYRYHQELALPGTEFRAVNAGYTESTGTFVPKTAAIVPLGGMADVDRFIEQTRSNLNDQRASQAEMKIKSLNFKFQDTFINGDVAVDANSFDGLKKLLNGGVNNFTTGANGIPVVGNGGTDIHAFFDALDSAIDAVDGADVLYMNRLIRNRIRSAARRTGQVQQTLDTFGRVLETYNGIPMVNLGNKADNTPIITTTEVEGTAVDSSSIYIVRFGNDEADGAVTGLTNGGIMVDDLGFVVEGGKPIFRLMVEFYCGLALFGATGAARLRGVRNA